VHMGFTILTGFGSMLGVHFAKKSAMEIVFAFAVLSVITYFHWRKSRDRFLHWPCPRCGAEWPGDKNEKDRACKVCGLRLGQETP